MPLFISKDERTTRETSNEFQGIFRENFLFLNLENTPHKPLGNGHLVSSRVSRWLINSEIQKADDSA